MADKYQNKYCIPTNRLQGWDYGNNGMYFITICTCNRIHFFGNIINGEMQLNEMGTTANILWKEIPKQFPFIELGKYVIMPNHIHGLLTVETQFIASYNDTIASYNDTIASGNKNQDAINCVSTLGGFAGNKNPLLNQNISRVIRWYKGRCTFEIRKTHADFLWQTRFYDHVVRNKQSLQQIEDYIESNPLRWTEDIFDK